jgi:AcrR family transcriptional regulator
MTDLRTRRRIAAMHRAQDAALDLFERAGFDEVSVEQVAARAGSSPATVYRHFGTKENLVLWDPYDPVLLELLGPALAARPPLAALRHALDEGLAGILDADGTRVLRRTRLVFREPAILSAMRNQLAGLRAGLLGVLRHAGVTTPDPGVLAAAAVAALEVAMDRWQAADGARSLATEVRAAMDALAELDTG